MLAQIPIIFEKSSAFVTEKDAALRSQLPMNNALELGVALDHIYTDTLNLYNSSLEPYLAQ